MKTWPSEGNLKDSVISALDQKDLSLRLNKNPAREPKS